MVGQSVSDRLKNLKSRIDLACARSGRPVNSVKLLAVSKLQPIAKIMDAYACGQRDFAENYVQEANAKRAMGVAGVVGLTVGLPVGLPVDLSVDMPVDLPVDLRWHFIGRIQSKKVAQVAGKYFAIHSVDSWKLAEKLNQHCAAQNVVQNIYVQLNVAAEASKGGFAKDELESKIGNLRGLANLKILGLMVMPPLFDNPELARPFFREAREILQRLNGVNKAMKVQSEMTMQTEMTELSMGTSHDFEVAIEEGATWIRVGSEVFGPRE